MEWVERDRGQAPWRRGLGPLAALILAATAACTGAADQDRGGSWEGPGVPDAAVSAEVGASLPVLAEGLARSMEEAARGLAEGRRAHAMKAADEAVRVGEVALFAAGGAAQFAMARGVRAVDEARRRVQIGQPQEARRRLEETSRWLRGQMRGLDAPGPAPTLPPWHLVEDDKRYLGARLINARGAPLGEVVGFVRDGDRIGRVIVARGWRDFLGFWDVSGELLAVPASALVFGPAKTVGTTLIALAESPAPDRLRRR